MHDITHTNDLGKIFALIPSVIGYYPTNSLVVMNFDIADDHALIMGPMLRTDLGTLTHDDLVDAITMYSSISDIVLCLIVGDERTIDAGVYDELVDAERHGYIAGVWRTNTIAEGEAFTQCVPETDTPIDGTIASVMANPMAHHLISKGVLPEVNRDTLLGYFAYAGRNEDMARLERAATTIARTASTMLRDKHDPTMMASLVEAAAHTIENAPEDDLLPDIVTVPDAHIDEVELTALMACIGTSRGRDALALTLLDHPRRASHVLLSIAIHMRGEIRANALCLWALIAVGEQLGSIAHIALETAAQEVPGHNLTRLLTQVIDAGMYNQLMTNFVKGSSDTLDMLGIER